ncbi:hypothetical protein [Streptomyces sp. NPDC018693]|uniref:hypothetical protein n=1 Tax=unclassified Streptomyces TaxID=2593676 RepID=UPI0037B96493
MPETLCHARRSFKIEADRRKRRECDTRHTTQAIKSPLLITNAKHGENPLLSMHGGPQKGANTAHLTGSQEITKASLRPYKEFTHGRAVRIV